MLLHQGRPDGADIGTTSVLAAALGAGMLAPAGEGAQVAVGCMAALRPAPRVGTGAPGCLCADEVAAVLERTDRTSSQADVSPAVKRLDEPANARCVGDIGAAGCAVTAP